MVAFWFFLGLEVVSLGPLVGKILNLDDLMLALVVGDMAPCGRWVALVSEDNFAVHTVGARGVFHHS